jgi:hypothetical protein
MSHLAPRREHKVQPRVNKRLADFRTLAKMRIAFVHIALAFSSKSRGRRSQSRAAGFHQRFLELPVQGVDTAAQRMVRYTQRPGIPLELSVRLASGTRHSPQRRYRQAQRSHRRAMPLLVTPGRLGSLLF